MNYYMKLTATGSSKVAAAQAGGDPVSLTEMALGDGNGNPVGLPVGDETALVNEVYRGALSSISVNENDAAVVMAESYVPAATGGWSVREVGIYDAAGDLFAYGNFPDTYKPTAAEGSTRDMSVVAALRVQGSDNVELVIDTTLVGATRAYVDSSVADHAASRNHPDATTAARGFAKLATPEQAVAGESTTLSVTPEGLQGKAAEIINALQRERRQKTYFMGQN